MVICCLLKVFNPFDLFCIHYCFFFIYYFLNNGCSFAVESPVCLYVETLGKKKHFQLKLKKLLFFFCLFVELNF